VHEARAFAGGNTARRRRARDALREKCGIDVARGPGPDPGADLRFGAVRGDREEGAVGENTSTVSPSCGLPSTLAMAPENTQGCRRFSDFSRPGLSISRKA
jgi:hypothetical protein